jgi:hypothetical protein
MNDVSQTAVRKGLISVAIKVEGQRAVPCTGQPSVDAALHQSRFRSDLDGNATEINVQFRPKDGGGEGNVSP